MGKENPGPICPIFTAAWHLAEAIDHHVRAASPDFEVGCRGSECALWRWHENDRKIGGCGIVAPRTVRPSGKVTGLVMHAFDDPAATD